MNTNRTFGIVTFLLLLLILPVTIFMVNTKQTYQQSAAGPTGGTMIIPTVSISPSPGCHNRPVCNVQCPIGTTCVCKLFEVCPHNRVK